MSDQPIKMDRGEGFRETVGVAKALGEQLIETKRGLIKAIDAPGYSTMTVKHTDPTFNRIGLLLYVTEESDVGSGMICQMTPTEARTIAASLLKLAADLDPGKPN